MLRHTSVHPAANVSQEQAAAQIAGEGACRRAATVVMLLLHDILAGW
jgi:hypothetical protein